MKKLVAYSSVAHLGFVMLGLFAFDLMAWQGALLQMVNHGLSTGALFLLVGMLYDRRHTKEFAEFGGLAKVMPWFAFFLVFSALASVGLPALNGFAGEFLILLGTWKSQAADLRLAAAAAAFGVVLAAIYLLKMVQLTFWGPLDQGGEREPQRPLLARSVWCLVPLCVLMLWIGVAPQRFLAPSQPELAATLDAYRERLAAPPPAARPCGTRSTASPKRLSLRNRRSGSDPRHLGSRRGTPRRRSAVLRPPRLDRPVEPPAALPDRVSRRRTAMTSLSVRAQISRASLRADLAAWVADPPARRLRCPRLRRLLDAAVARSPAGGRLARRLGSPVPVGESFGTACCTADGLTSVRGADRRCSPPRCASSPRTATCAASGILAGEYHALLLWCACGLLLMCAPTELLTIFVALELLSVCLYALAGFTAGGDRHRGGASSTS